MKSFVKIAVFLMSSLTLSMSVSSCNGAKAYVKKGKKMEEAGIINQAAAHYYTALIKKPQNIDALVGLKRTGQIVLSRQLADFDESVLRGDRESAISSFQKADNYYNKLQAVNVSVEFPIVKRNQFESVKNAHVEEIYVEGSAHLEKARYEEALEIFERIEELVPGYKDAKKLGDYSYCKPRYDKGKEAHDSELYRTSYNLFSEIVERDSDFEDAVKRKAEALETGRYTIALLKFENGSNVRNVHTKLSAYVEQNLMGSHDPFLTIVDRESLEMILQEQHLELSGLTSGTELEIGSLLGAKAILKGTVMSCSHSQTSLRTENKSGFEKYRVEKVNSEGKKYYETKYRPAGYREYFQSGTVTMTFNLKLVSMESGTVLSSKTVTTTMSDNVHYAHYSGNKNNLYPASISGNVNSSITAHNELVSLIGSRRDLKNSSVMIEEATKGLASKVQSEVEAILLQTVK
ncbi:MAG: hypothetical protein CL823_06400 [Crocinitomicaceae bacterium]|nr:hypothetical protein [Crocinitomicaceae bacterium]